MANLISYLGEIIISWPLSFLSGVISGLFANLIWHKLFLRYFQNKNGPHFSLEHSEAGYAFTGLMSSKNADEIKSQIEAAYKITKKKESTTIYEPSSSAANTTTSKN